MRDKRVLAAVREDKRAFAGKGYGQDEAGRVRLMQMIAEKKIVYRPGFLSVLRMQLRYFSGWEALQVPCAAVVLALTCYARERMLLDMQQVFLIAALWLIVSTACVVGGLEVLSKNHMGELAATCYLSFGQLLCVRLILGAAGELSALAAFVVFLGGCGEAGSAPIGVYLLLVWMGANTVYFFIFAAVRGKGQIPALAAAALLLSFLAFFMSVLVEGLFVLSGGVCAFILLLCALALGGELAYVFHGIGRGEFLCFD